MPIGFSGTSFCERARSLVFACFFLLAGTVANAVTIDFDELDRDAYLHDGDLTPLSNEYESLGVVFFGLPYLLRDLPGVQPAFSSPNFVGGPGVGFYFVGVLPTYVSLYVSSSTGSRVWVEAAGPNGYDEGWLTDGEVHGMTVVDSDSTPYRPNQFVAFEAAEGIASVSLSSQGDTAFDNLTFTRPTAVAEPPAVLLLALGLTGLAWQRQRHARRCQPT